MEFAKLSAPSLKDLFVQQLQGMILSDELPMGTQLPPERELAQQMQVSRAVVNGGLAELAQQGFLEVRPRQGTRGGLPTQGEPFHAYRHHGVSGRRAGQG